MSRLPGSPKTGGRRKGSIDRNQRQLVSAELGYSIIATFEMLGGTTAMLEWAQDNKTIFYTQILSRMMPAPLKEDPDVLIQQQFNGLSDFEAARHIAFALAKAMNLQGTDQQEITPQEACRPDSVAESAQRWQAPHDLPRESEPITDDELAKLAEAKAAEELANRQHRGSAAEHGLTRPAPVERSTRVPVRLRRPLI